MKLEEKLTKLGFTQNPYNEEQWVNKELDVNVYIEPAKISGVQICKSWFLGKQNLNDYDIYLSKVRNLINEVNKIL